MSDEEYDTEVGTWRQGSGGDSPKDRIDSLHSQVHAWSAKFDKEVRAWSARFDGELINIRLKAGNLDRQFQNALKELRDSQQAAESQIRRQLEEHEKKTSKQISNLAFLFFLLLIGFVFLAFAFFVRGAT